MEQREAREEGPKRAKRALKAPRRTSVDVKWTASVGWDPVGPSIHWHLPKRTSRHGGRRDIGHRRISTSRNDKSRITITRRITTKKGNNIGATRTCLSSGDHVSSRHRWDIGISIGGRHVGRKVSNNVNTTIQSLSSLVNLLRKEESLQRILKYSHERIQRIRDQLGGIGAIVESSRIDGQLEGGKDTALLFGRGKDTWVGENMLGEGATVGTLLTGAIIHPAEDTTRAEDVGAILEETVQMRFGGELIQADGARLGNGGRHDW